MADRSPRAAAAELLLKVSKNAYSNLALDGLLSGSDYSRQDKNFISRLFYGVIERKVTLDHVISLYSKKPLHKLDAAVLVILRMGVYQLRYMESVPDNAAVNESVNLAKKMGKTSAAPFVNAVLRNFIRDGKEIKLPEDPVKRMSIEYSCPAELAARLTDQYGSEKTEAFLRASLEPHKMYIRVNNTLVSPQELSEKLSAVGVKNAVSGYDSCCIETDSIHEVDSNELFRQGLFHVQDLSSQLCSKALDPHKGEAILDICAAPGGKTFTIAEITGDDCTLYACDLHAKRAALIKKGAERLKLTSVKALQNDAKVFNSDFPVFDKILCDVPCSGLGVIRSKPEIKYTPLKDIAALPEIQYNILETAARYLRKGGELVYSTCTVLKEENDAVIDRFLSEHDEFEGVPFLEELGAPFGSYKAVIMAESFDCEGFFISKIRRKN